jgi:hypothetical protein
MMTPYSADYVLPILDRAIADRNDERGNGGAAKVAVELGTSDSLISQLRARTYTSPQKWYRKIIALYGHETVTCPTLGEISLIRCDEEKAMPPGSPSAAYVHQRRTCSRCSHNQGGAK